MLNKRRGNMYEFVSHTWNPIKGECPHKCEYCFMRTISRYKHDQRLRLDTNELAVKLGKDKFIFLGSSTDMFAKDIPTEWIVAVYDHCMVYNENRYLFQSKNPSRFLSQELINHPLMKCKEDVFFASTIETNRNYPRVSNAPLMGDRIAAMSNLSQMGYNVMITMEPIMEFDLDDVLKIMNSIRPFQVNIGFNTDKSVKLPEPSREQTLDLIRALRQLTTVEIKSNSTRVLGKDLSAI